MPTKVRKIDFSSDEWISGCLGLTLEEEGLYIRLTARIYSHGGALPVVDLAAHCNSDPRRFIRLLGRLIAKGKVRCYRGDRPDFVEMLTIDRCEVELKSARHRIEVARKNGAEGGRPNGLAKPDGLSGEKLTTTTTITTIEDSAPSGALVDPGSKVADDMLAVWREVCGHIHNPGKLQKDRAAKLTARWKDSFGNNAGEWRACCERVCLSPLLSGQKRDWRATLDWVIEPRNLRKILEGNYDDRVATAQVLPLRETDPETEWRGRLGCYREYSGKWATTWGPPPPDPECQAPLDLLVEFGHRKRERTA